LILNIESVERGPKSFKVHAGGKTYYAAFKVQGVEQLAGKQVDAVVTDNTFNGRSFSWIDAFQVTGSAPTPTAKAPEPYAAGRVSLDRWYMAFVSNTVAHAIQSGYIQSPDDIAKWAKAAKNAAESLEDIFEIV
jgi:hypothetical protein